MPPLRPPIYSDIDNVLIGPIKNSRDELTGLEVRPDAAWFLESLSRYGELSLLTAANRTWANTVLDELGEAVRFVRNVYTIEDLYPVALALEMIDRSGVSQRDKEELYGQVAPILPPGVIFDDYPVGSWMYWLKGLATGIANLNPRMWIEVEAFKAGTRDRGGLRRAFSEFLSRNGEWTRGRSLSGRLLVG